ncbi:MAG: BMP family ABC transporter substrate-binding protein, partial [Oscillospiraceae bacterium]|nr:BMP family ABC transporter substrate-binding protein [Oscillospiraceae bacterium]
MKKLFATVLAFAMALSLAACGAKESAAPAASAPAASAPAASSSAEAAGLKICIVTSSGIDDGSFNQNCYKGIQDFIADHPDCTVTDVKEPDYNELINTVDRLVGDYDVFVLPGFNFSTVGDVVLNNPDKYFLVVDSTITDSQGNPVTQDNVYTMTFSEQEGGFFA